MKVLVFSGTSEGKEIIKYLNNKKVETTACVATQYGKDVMDNMDNDFVSIHTGRLNQNQMTEFIKNFDFVIDATHPFAKEVTKNIILACQQNNVEYIRLLREESFENGVVYVDSVDDAISFLQNTIGKIFVSTGSKELYKYTKIENYKDRLVARVLPLNEARENCLNLKISNVIYKKGPFSYSDNYNEFKKWNIQWLVTKSSGKNGGFDEKIKAAKDLNINIIVIKRPTENYGLSMEKVKKIIDDKIKNFLKFPLFIDLYNKQVVIVGCGNVATRRINTLLNFGAKIKVIALDFKEIYDNSNITYIQKGFEKNDLDGAFMVIAATNDRFVNHSIFEFCKNKNIFYSIADCKEECNFFFPAICLTDELSVGIVSNGENHKTVKEKACKIRRLIGDEK